MCAGTYWRRLLGGSEYLLRNALSIDNLVEGAPGFQLTGFTAVELIAYLTSNPIELMQTSLSASSDLAPSSVVKAGSQGML